MKRANIFIIIFILFLVASCSQQDSEWKGSIKTEDGVTIVENPRIPLYEENIFNLEEDLIIGGSEGKDNYQFSEVSDIAVDSDENIYVLDSKESHIKVFDKKGNYLKTIGRKGQGPGEMQMLVYVQITSQNEIMIYDYMLQRLTFFSLDGGYLRQKNTAKTRDLFLPIKMDSNGNLIVFADFAPPPLGGKKLKIYDSNLELLTIVAKEERGMRGVIDIGKPELYCNVSPNDNIIVGNSREYVLQIFNQKGDLIKKISKEHNFIKITAEDKKTYKKKYAEPIERGMKINFRSHFPAFSEISIDDEGRIFVKTYQRIKGKDSVFYFDVFESGGKYTAKIPVKANLNRNSVWKKNKLYTIEEDKEGYQVVKRYKVNWNY